MKQQKRSSHWFSEWRIATHWIADLLNITIEQLIFVDEFLFNEITDWRLRAYALIDQSARYRDNITRDCVWSVLSAYISNDKCCLISFECLILLECLILFKYLILFECLILFKCLILFECLILFKYSLSHSSFICRLFALYRHQRGLL
jgi:hypothetical protein